MDVLEALQGLEVTPRATAAISARLVKVGSCPSSHERPHNERGNHDIKEVDTYLEKGESRWGLDDYCVSRKGGS